MYLNFYDLQHDPFANTAAPEMLFLSRGHEAALQALIDGLTAGQACIALLGEPGLGKTFLLHAALAHSDLQHIRAVHIFYPKLSTYDILKMICWELGCDGVTQDAEKLITSCHDALLTEHACGRPVVLIVDEADTVPSETLERLVWLAHLSAATGAPLLQIVLAGLPAFWQHCYGALFQSGKQRLATCLTLTPFTYTESLAYIRHRLLKACAWEDTVFTARAVRKIANHARGNPRVINVLCTNLLITGFLAMQKPIPATMARDVIATYEAKRSSPRWWRGVAYAAGVLAVAGLAGAFRYGYLAISERGSQNLSQLTHSRQDISSVDTAPQPIAREVAPLLPWVSAPPPSEEDPPSQAAPDEMGTPSAEVTALPEPLEPF